MPYLFLLISLLIFIIVKIITSYKINKKLAKKDVSSILISSFLVSLISLPIIIFTKLENKDYLFSLIIICLFGYFNPITSLKEFFKNKSLFLLGPVAILFIELFLFNKRSISSHALINFNYLRYLIFVLIFLIMLIIFKNKSHLKTSYFATSFENKIFILLAISLGLFIIYTIFNNSIYYLKYPLNYADFNISKNPYHLLFEALENHSLSLLIEPSSELIALDNPYGYRGDIDYLWDFAFYNNKYYVYFGIAPVITIYYPVYLLSLGNYIPTYTFLNQFLLINGLYISLLALYRAYRHFTNEFNYIIFIICLFSLWLSGGLGFLFGAETMYNTPILFALVSFYYLVYFAFRGVERQSFCSFTLMGIFFVLIVASRLNMSISVIILFPILIPYLFNKRFLVRLKSLLGCFISMGILLTLLGLYNYYRFDNFLEFGAKYQLTVSDISLNKIDLSYLKAALHYYVLQKPYINDTAPFLILALDDLETLGITSYIYTFPTFGLFIFPLSFFSIFGLVSSKNFKHFLINILVIIYIVGVSLVNFSLGGVHIRYLMDILPIVIFFALLNILVIYNKMPNNSKKVFLIIVLFVTILNTFVALNLYINEWYIEINYLPWLKNFIYNLLNV